jgi:hypothetical protein
VAGKGPTVTDNGGDSVRQFPSHASLIASDCALASSAATGLDAIIVPAGRPAGNLHTAVHLAAETGAVLIVLCSFPTHADEVRTLLAQHNLPRQAVIEMPSQCDDWILRDFETANWVREGLGKGLCGPRTSDLSMKRNAGLLLARMHNWKRIFFLDDGIRGISADAILETVSLLARASGGHRTAAMSVREYPDNSGVCHARREVGEYQDVFVSGSVLAVDSGVAFDFFPDLYNEDWLFFYRDAAEGRLATAGSRAYQLRYDPFADPLRSAGQEFGDVIAEGLYALLHYSRGKSAADESYWKVFLSERNKILDTVSRRLASLHPELRRRTSKAMGAAQQVLWCITAQACAAYVGAWQRDLRRWRRLLENLPPLTGQSSRTFVWKGPDARTRWHR